MVEKHKLSGNFEKTLKIFDKSSFEKIEFLTIFGKVVAKNRAFENNIIFLQHFFQFRGGGNVLYVPPGGAYGILLEWILEAFKSS